MSSALAVGVAAASAIAAATLLGALSLLPAAHEVRNAADAAALAAADTLLGWSADEPCEQAERLARTQQVRLQRCECEATRCRVETVRIVLGIPLVGRSLAGSD